MTAFVISSGYDSFILFDVKEQQLLDVAESLGTDKTVRDALLCKTYNAVLEFLKDNKGVALYLEKSPFLCGEKKYVLIGVDKAIERIEEKINNLILAESCMKALSFWMS